MRLKKCIKWYFITFNYLNPSISIPKIAVGEAVRRMRTCESLKTERSADFRLEVDIWGFPIPQNGATGGRSPPDFGFQPSHVNDLINYKLTSGMPPQPFKLYCDIVKGSTRYNWKAFSLGGRN